MDEPTAEVNASHFEELCTYYSGDSLGKNKCKAVAFADRLWTVTGIVSGGKLAPSVRLHELVPPERYEGSTGEYPFDSDGVFYKGQAVKAKGRPFVMSGRSLTVIRGDDATESKEPDTSQLDLLDWREETPPRKSRKKTQSTSRGGQKNVRPLASKRRPAKTKQSPKRSPERR